MYKIQKATEIKVKFVFLTMLMTLYIVSNFDLKRIHVVLI
jgi:hypothetical protein